MAKRGGDVDGTVTGHRRHDVEPDLLAVDRRRAAFLSVFEILLQPPVQFYRILGLEFDVIKVQKSPRPRQWVDTFRLFALDRRRYRFGCDRYSK